MCRSVPLLRGFLDAGDVSNWIPQLRSGAGEQEPSIADVDSGARHLALSEFLPDPARINQSSLPPFAVGFHLLEHVPW